ncbi:MAG: T9SS type A sorting domain-containing protein [Bacteroidales bacterium]|nr:T9SS type A sorting domain-containing protein [Bacteroidales bacterium]
MELTKSAVNSLKVYPNPVTENSEIEFTNTLTGYVSLDVCDLRGLRVWQVVNSRLMPGTYTFPIDKTRFKNGLYIVTLSSPTGMASIKLIVND